MPHHDGELGEVEANLLEEHHVLALRRHTRPGDARVDDDGDLEVDAGLVDRVVAAIVDRHLRTAARWEGGDRLDVVLGLGRADLPHGASDVVGVDLEGREEPVGVLSEGALRQPAIGTADHPDRDAAAIHLTQGGLDRIGALGQMARHVLEHVLGRELHLLAALVLRRFAKELIVFARVGGGEPDHQVHRPDPLWHRHAR